MKLIKVIAITLLILIICAQLIPRVKNNSVIDSDRSFSKFYDISEDIEIQLRISCYDCHSNNTRYPWYSAIQPINIIMNGHVNDGKAELNFDIFGTYSNRKRRAKLKSIINQLKDNKMPLKSYELLHNDAKISINKKDDIIKWLEKLD